MGYRFTLMMIYFNVAIFPILQSRLWVTKLSEISPKFCIIATFVIAGLLTVIITRKVCIFMIYVPIFIVYFRWFISCCDQSEGERTISRSPHVSSKNASLTKLHKLPTSVAVQDHKVR